MPVDVDEAGSVRLLIDHMVIPDLVIEGAGLGHHSVPDYAVNTFCNHSQRRRKAAEMQSGSPAPACSKSGNREGAVALLRGCRLGLAGFLLLGNARLLAAQSAQVIELCAADLATAHDLDRVEHRRIEREYALDPLTVRNLAHREALVDAATRARDAQALIGLYARALALDDLHVDDQRVAGREIRDYLAGGELFDLLLFNLLQQVHGLSPAAAPRAGRSGGRDQRGWASFYCKVSGLSPVRHGFDLTGLVRLAQRSGRRCWVS